MMQNLGQLQQSINNIMEKKTKEIEAVVKKQALAKVPAIQKDIYTYYTAYIKKYITEYFAKTYGVKNYSEKSLIDSLSFSKNGFHPDFSYKENAFKWNKQLSADTEKFNAYSSEETRPIGYMDELDETEYQEDIDNDGILMDYVDYSKHNPKKQFNYYNKLNKQGGFLSLKEAYKKAYIEANKGFREKLDSEILPSLNKKYGLNMK